MLARHYSKEKKYPEAAALYENAMRRLEKTSGPNSPDLAGLLEEYAMVEKTLQNYAEAEQARVRSLGIRVKQALRAESPK